MKVRAAFALPLLVGCVLLAYQLRAPRQAAAPASLTSYVPQDALLTIESPDFAALLRGWTNSAESKAWLSSQNYAVFRNSRLFGRLTDAQATFAKADGFPATVDLLNQVAGRESVFAWYDIGKLQFLYITRMPAAQADQSQLLQARSSYERRHSGNYDFYIRTANADYSTVAFARVPQASGDLILLATRADLIANALRLISAPAPANSIRQEPWFRDASAALPAERPAPALHMVLNLSRIAFDPHFQSYWIQRNITWTRQFRAAVSDLYLEPARFREERVLLPAATAFQPAARDLAPLAALVPPSTGVYRVVATEDPALAVTAIEEKLIGSYTAPPPDPDLAPDPTLDAPQSGSASDLEISIDAVPSVSATASTDALGHVFQGVGVDAVLTLSSAQPAPQKDSLWIPIHSAVVLHAASPANPQALASALQQTLRGSLTAAGIGIDLRPTSMAGTPVYALTGPRSLYFATSSTQAQGNLILLADDQALLAALLQRLSATAPRKTTPSATLIAAFNHFTQRASYLRLTSLIDGTNHSVPPTTDAPADASATADSTPAFFSRNIGSLSQAFASLESEQVIERLVDSNLRQTVTYEWGTR